MTTILADIGANKAGYDVNITQYISDVTDTTSGYNVNSDYNVTDGAINSSGFGDAGTPLLTSSGCLIVNISGLIIYDDSDDPVSSKTVEVFNDLKATVLIPALFFIGFPTNCLNLLVFFKHNLKQRINMCLFCLSLVDLIYITFRFMMYVEQVRPGAMDADDKTALTVVTFIVNNHLLGLSGFGWASLFISAIISGERCFCVIWPLRSSTLLKTRTTAIVLLIGVALIVAGRFAVTERFRISCLYNLATEKMIASVTPSRYYVDHKEMVDILDSVVYGMVVPMTTCTFVTVATVVTAVRLKQVAQWRQESSSALSAREIALTRMLIYLSVQFIVLSLPNVLLRVTSVIVPNLRFTGRFNNLFFLLTGVVEISTALNSSLNFLVYFLAGSKYRETVRGLCGKAATKKKAVLLNVNATAPNSNTSS